MKNIITFLVIVIITTRISYSQDIKKENTTGEATTGSSSTTLSWKKTLNIDPEFALRNFETWWQYNSGNIKLCENYSAFDDYSQPISKEAFLTSLSTGEYVAFRIKTMDSSFKYQLYRLQPSIENATVAEAKEFGKVALQNYKREGTVIPGFNFIDLNGNIYNNETTKEKIVVLKCWFINCTVCVQEMPFLNKIVKQYEDRKDIVFISLAFDSKEKLQAFLTNRKFDYAVIPAQQKFIEEELKVTVYPTQFIINKSGIIAKVISDCEDLASVLKNVILQ